MARPSKTEQSDQPQAPAGPIALAGEAEGRGPASPVYAAPALDKGLDILELLSSEDQPLTPQQIAQKLSRSSSEIFRMLETLQRRGYLSRTQPGGAYRLTLKLFELANRQPHLRRLTDVAAAHMHELARQTFQSNHLVVHHDRRILVVAQVDSPDAWSFSVRLGAHFDFDWGRVSARVLTAFQKSDARREQMIDDLWTKGTFTGSRAELVQALADIRRAGFDQRQSPSHFGITDLGSPVFDHTGNAIASLAQPYFQRPQPSCPLEQAVHQHRACAAAISRNLGHCSD